MPLNGKQQDRSLRPWGDVARLFAQKTGQAMTPQNAWMTHRRAMEKLRGHRTIPTPRRRSRPELEAGS